MCRHLLLYNFCLVLFRFPHSLITSSDTHHLMQHKVLARHFPMQISGIFGRLRSRVALFCDRLERNFSFRLGSCKCRHLVCFVFILLSAKTTVRNLQYFELFKLYLTFEIRILSIE